MTPTVNALATGTWAAREGQPVEYVDTKPNRLAVGVRVAGEKRVCYIPARWVDGLDPTVVLPAVTVPNTQPAPDVCPCCGRPL